MLVEPNILSSNIQLNTVKHLNTHLVHVEMETTVPRNRPTLKQLMHSGGDGGGNGVPSRRKPPIHKHNEEEVKLAALAITFNMRLRSADMPLPMQERALRHSRALLDAAAHRRRPNPTLLARSLKKEFDSVYGPAWHCVAGKSFGSFVTHTPGGFLYFSVDSLSFLLFKTEVHPISQTS